MVTSGFDLFGAYRGLIMTGRGFEQSDTDTFWIGMHCYTTNNIIIRNNDKLDIYDKKTNIFKKSVAYDSGIVYGVKDRVIIIKNNDKTEERVYIYNEDLDLIKVIGFNDTWIGVYGYGFDDTYIYIASGIHGKEGCITKFDLNGNLIAETEKWYTAAYYGAIIAVDKNYIYSVEHIYIVKRDKNTLKKIYSILRPANTVYQIFALGDFLYVNTKSTDNYAPCSCYKLNKSDGSVVSNYKNPIIGTSKDYIYSFEYINNIKCFVAMDLNFNIVSSIPLGFSTNSYYPFDMNADYPTFLVYTGDRTIEVSHLGADI